MPLCTAAELRKLGKAIFAAAGALPSEAEEVARALVEANLAGHDSHGVIRIPQYIAAIERGEIVPGAEVEVVTETPASAVLDGHWGFGAVLAGRAVELGAGKARRSGVAALTLRCANHIGRLGGYVEALARRGMIGMLFANMHGAGVCVVPWGGRTARLGTNPLAVGIPAAPGPPLVLDMTTSAVAEGKVRLRRQRGEEAPEGWLLDALGRPSRDPQVLYDDPRGALLPFGGRAGHKGYGLGVVVELLAGALSGAGCAGRAGARLGNGVFLLVLDVEQFAPLEAFYREVDHFVSFVKSAPLMEGYDAILMPGEAEERQRAKRRRRGIFVEEETWRQLAGCGRRLGVSIPVGKEEDS